MNQHIFIFELYNHVHFPMFLHCWLNEWRSNDMRGHMTLLVTRAFMRTQPDLVRLAETMPRANITFMMPTQAERDHLKRLTAQSSPDDIRFSDLLRTSYDFDPRNRHKTVLDLFNRYAAQIGADINLHTYIDDELPLIVSGAPLPPFTAALHLMPVFHHAARFGTGTAAYDLSAAVQQKFAVARVLRNPNLKRLLYIDPYVVDALRGFEHGEKAVFLPEPVIMETPSPGAVTALRHQLGIEPPRKVLLVFGSVNKRKGIDTLVEALLRLPSRAAQAVCLVVAGKIDPDYRAIIDTLVQTLTTHTPVQIIRHDHYIADADIPAFFHMADVCCALYRRHWGPSNFVLLAAAAARPILSTSQGLMGYLVREHGLGITADVENIDQVVTALERLLDAPESVLSPADQRAAFVAQHDPTAFARAFFAALSD